MTAGESHKGPGRGALAMVVGELDRLPRVDDRYRLWPWSLRAFAERRGWSPATVHKHRQALLAAGVLVTDEQGRTLVDTTRVDEVQAVGAPRASYGGHRRQASGSTQMERSGVAPAATGAEADVLVAIEALTSAVEARRDLAGVLVPIIGRLTRLLEDPALVAGGPAAHPRVEPEARAQAEGARGRSRGDRGPDQHRCSASTGVTARQGARDRAPLQKERKTQESRSPTAIDSQLPGLSFSNDHEARAGGGARRRRATGARDGARPVERLLDLLGPLDPARHMTYLEGVQAALGRYDDTQIAHAVGRIVLLDKATINPIGLLVDRANAGDPLYFPPPAADAHGGPPELPMELWSTKAAAEEPGHGDMEGLPAFDPDPTLAPAIAARAALEAARQPVTREKLAARQAELATADTGVAPDTDGGKSDHAGQAA